ncbi:MAG: undecaprenyl-diphosphatase [Hydrogenophilales bacterium CG03_land_8_20_14_0_80_62_28]|nr:undecaprenyl-diphosphate phosphatase [Betaproteobacteria bacterium]OIO78221.1 MAG: undecaprenyl-diphosphatase [Hydrogenophilaceae bacterium CG1_02_62_390]PIV24014.1 MAG: undecaprenyl-diphosphatase [Hydrogenophilales bacterium CG03_land_8_20_14_0_80_62_28]PIW39234.1 MAG: undecaprenyl-diphosphatase [Hydrogenophilales bacterium CG15_BIG_FIL_POST_REV_8_21_14_020_62_31]PIW71958.1 MAG: undecaprenyl-diphosphatase [Hydrogenophilales bacterium CG12_big_fil_rev_8_21_14_0_65_61_21]PIX01308.1 MAG: unde
MDNLLILKAAILGIVEGLTEFLPVSSTGHLIVAGQLLHFNDDKGKVFEIAIQLAAILAVVWVYRQRLGHVVASLKREPAARKFTLNLIVAFMPAAVLGLLFLKEIKAYLFNPLVVATAFIVGGLLILWAERRQHVIRAETVDDMTWQDALKVGFAQSLAMIPGTSRSGATIIGGLFFGLSRQAATEFSFFLAIPTMFAATLYDVYKHRALFSVTDLPLFAVGSAVSFISALICVRWLLRYIASHDFTPFAWYRIAFGAIVLVTDYLGLIDWSGG